MGVEIIVRFAEQLMNFFIPELLFLIFVEKSKGKFKFRFSSIEYYPQLRPFANTWVVGIVAFLIYFLYAPIFELLIGATIESWLVSLGTLNLILLTVSLCAFTLIFIVNYLFEKKLDRNTAILGAVTIIFFIIFLRNYL